jgi:hypothetical protein
MLDINASADGVFVFISQILSASPSTAPKRPALGPHNAHHFGRGKAAGPGLGARLVDSNEKAARRARWMREQNDGYLRLEGNARRPEPTRKFFRTKRPRAPARPAALSAG